MADINKKYPNPYSNEQDKQDNVQAQVDNMNRSITQQAKKAAIRDYYGYEGNQTDDKSLKRDALSGLTYSYEKQYGRAIPFALASIDNTLSMFRNSSTILYRGEHNVEKDAQAAALKQSEQDFLSSFDSISLLHNFSDTPSPADQDFYQSHTGHGIHQTDASMYKGLKNIQDKKAFMFWDLETMPGTDRFGRDIQSQITEFSFQLFDTKGEPIKGQSYGSIIGSTQDLHATYIDIIDKAQRGEGLTDNEKVAFDRLKLMGAATLDTTKAKEGIYTYATFPDKSEVPGADYDLARKGANELRRIGAEQSKTLTEYNGYKVKGWEKQLLTALDEIHKNQYTIAGHNILEFDIDVLNKMLSSDMLSMGAKKYMQSAGYSTIDTTYVTDTLAIVRRFTGNTPLTAEEEALMKEKGLTRFQQEFLVRAKLPADDSQKFYGQGKAAHAASIDVAAGAKLVTSDYFSLDNIKSILPASLKQAKDEKVGVGNNLYYAAASVDPVKNHLFSFTTEAFYGGEKAFHTNTGLMDFKGGTQQALFGQPGLQRGVAYSITSIGNFDMRLTDMSDDARQRLKELYPSMAFDELTAITFTPETGRDPSSYKSFSPITYVGTKDRMQQMLNQLYLIGKKDADGNWTAEGVPDSVYEELGLTKVEDGSVTHLSSKKDVQPFLDRSYHNLMNDTAARTRREYSLKKDRQLLQYIDYIDSQAQQIAGPNATEEELEEARQHVRGDVGKRSRDIAAKLSRNETVTSAEIENTYFKFFGWKDKNDYKYHVYRNTVDSAIASEQYMRRNKEAYRAAVNYVNQILSPEKYSTDQVNAIYRHMMTSLIDAGTLKAPDKVGPKSTFWTDTEFANRFDIDVSGFTGFDPNKNKIMRISLNSSYSLASNLFAKLGVSKARFDKMSDEQKVSKLQQFQEYLINKKIISDIEYPEGYNPKIDINTNNAITASEKILYQLKAVRAQSPQSGILTDTIHYDLSDDTVANFGLTDDEINQTLQKAQSTFTMPMQLAASEKGVKLKAGTIGARQVAQNIVDKILFQDAMAISGEKDEVSAIAKLTGYTKEHAEEQLLMRNTRRKDMVSLWEKMIGSLRTNGGDLVVDYKNKILQVVNADGSLHQLENLPFDVFAGGINYTQIGGTRTLNPVGYYEVGYKDKAHLTYGSRIAKAASDVGWMNKALKRAAETDGDLAGALNDILSQFGQSMREIESVANVDAQDRRAVFHADFRALFDYLPQMYERHVFDNLKVTSKLDMSIGSDARTPVQIVKDYLRKNQGKDLDFENADLEFKTAANIVIPELIRQQDVLNNFIQTQSQAGSDTPEIMPKSLAEKVVTENKQAKSGIYTIYNSDAFGDRQGSQKRREQDTMARNFQFNATAVQKEIDSGFLQDVTVGSGIQTMDRFLQDTDAAHLGYDVDRTIQAKRLMATTADIRSLLLSDESVPQKMRDYFASIDTYEGSAAISPYLADTVFNARSSLQKIDASKILEYDGETLTNIDKYSSYVPQIQLKDGKISFNYNNGTFVQQGEELAHIKGYKGAQEAKLAKYDGIAKIGVFAANGMLADKESVEALLNNHQDTSNLIQALQDAQRNPDKERYYKAQAVQYLNSILKDSGFSQSLYLESLEAPTHIKISEMTAEKNMARSITPLMGTFNENIKAVFQDLAGAVSTYERNDEGKVIKRYGAQQILDIVPRKEILDSLLENKPLAQTAFGKMINAYRNPDIDKTLSSTAMEKAILRRFDSVEQFHKALLEERYSVWNEAQRILKQYGILDKNESLGFISNTSEAEIKHKNLNIAPQRVVDALSEKGFSNEQILDIFNNTAVNAQNEKVAAVSGLSIDKKSGRLIASAEAQINTDALNQISAKYLGRSFDDTGKVIDYESDKYFYRNTQNGTAITEEQYNQLTPETQQNFMRAHVSKNRTELSQNINYDQARVRSIDDAFGKRVKFTHRNFEILDNLKQDENTLSQIHQKFIQNYGQEVGEQKYNELYGNVKAGDRVYGAVSDSLKQHKYSVPGEDLIARFDSEGNRIDFYSTPENADAYQTEFIRGKNAEAQAKADKIIQQLVTEEGIDRKSIDAIIQTAGENGARGVSKSYIQNTFVGLSFSEAKRFNDGKFNLGIDYLKERGFFNDEGELFKIDQIETATDVDPSAKNSIYGKNMAIDLHLDNMSKEHQIYTSEADRYLALPYMSKSYMANHDLVKTEYQSQVSRLTSMIHNYQTDIENHVLNQDEIQNKKAEIQEQIQVVKDSISQELTQKKKILAQNAEVYLGDAAMFTSHGLALMGTEQNTSLNDLSFNGINLVQNAADMVASKGEKGFHLSYAIGSTAAMHRFYDSSLQDIAGELQFNKGLSKQFSQNVYKHLQTHGTVTVNSRDPQGYISSSNLNAMYFSDTVSGDSILVSRALQEAMKNDNDSDKISMAILKSTANISYTDQEGKTRTITKDIDYASYQALQGMKGVTVNFLDDGEVMHNARQGIISDAITVNPLHHNPWKEQESTLETRENDTQHLAENMVGGTTTGEGAFTSGRRYNEKERTHFLNQYQKLENAFAASLSDNDLIDYNSLGSAEQRNRIFTWAQNQKSPDAMPMQDVKDALEFRMITLDKAPQLTASDRKPALQPLDFSRGIKRS